MYYDIVHLDLFKNNKLEIIENKFSNLKINKVFIYLEINTKEDFDFFYNYKLPISSKLDLEKIYFTTNLNLVKNNIFNSIIKEGKKLIYYPDNLSKLSNSLSIKQDLLIYNPIYDKLGFDEGCCSLCVQNNKKLVFNLNLFKTNTYKSIKQIIFISKILQIHKVNFVFASFAKQISEIIDPTISIYFLSELGFNIDLVKKVFLEKL